MKLPMVLSLLLTGQAFGNQNRNPQIGRHFLSAADLTLTAGESPGGTSGTSVYKDSFGKNWFVKPMYASGMAANSLICSGLASELANFILPGSAPVVMPYLDRQGNTFIASLAIGSFEARTGNEENLLLLNFVLDLLNVEDRHKHNVGGVRGQGDKLSAAAVDLDQGLAFSSSWLESGIHLLSYSDQTNVKKSLESIARISDAEIRRVLENAWHNLKPVIFDLLDSTPNNFDALYDFEFILQSVLSRKAEMTYLLNNIDLLRLIKNPSLASDLELLTAVEKVQEFDDRFGLFLSLAIENDRVALIKWLLKKRYPEFPHHALSLAVRKVSKSLLIVLLEGGAKDPQALALSAAIQTNNDEFIEILLQYGVMDLSGRSLKEAVRKRNYALVEKLLAHGTKDRNGQALETAILEDNGPLIELLAAQPKKRATGNALKRAFGKGDSTLVERLLDRGATDGDCTLLGEAIEKNNETWIKKIIDNGFLGLECEALSKAVYYNNDEVAKTLLAKGIKDLDGHALKNAIKKGKDGLIEALLSYGAKDPNGLALRAALDEGKDSLVELLAKRGAKDPSGAVLRTAIGKNKDELVDILLKYGVGVLDGAILAEAIYNDKEELVARLLHLGAKDTERRAYWAAWHKGNKALMKMFDAQ